MKLKVPTLNSAWPYFAVITAHVIWAMNFIVAKVTLEQFPPMSLAFIRFALALLLLLPFLFFQKDKDNIQKKDIPLLFLVGALMTTFHISFFYLGLLRTSASTASILTMTIPVFSVLIGWIFLKEKIYTVNVHGIVLGLVGVLSVIGAPILALGFDINGTALIGNLLIILSTITWVIGVTISKKMLKHYSSLTITTVIFLTGVMTFVVPALKEYLDNPIWIQQVSIYGLLGLTYIVIASSLVAFFLFEWGLQFLGVVKSDLFQYIEPLLAVTLGIIILNESPRASFLIGASFVLIGVYMGTIGKPEHKNHKSHRT